MTTAMVDYYGDMHASEAIDIERWTRKKDGKGSPPTVVAILLYGSWNVRVASANRDDGVPRWVARVTAALSGARIPLVPVASVEVDADEASLDACVNDEARGGFGAPSELPALLCPLQLRQRHRAAGILCRV